MKSIAKAGLVAVGFAAATAIAALVVSLHVDATNGPDRQGAGGMYAFGDSLFFLVAFGLAAVPATCAALYWLRPRTAFWVWLSVASLVVAATSLVAFVVYATQGAGSPTNAWPALAVLRLIVAPMCGAFFFLAALFAPYRTARLRLLAAAAIEMTALGLIALLWFRAPH
jgi:hypothetical protein